MSAAETPPAESPGRDCCPACAGRSGRSVQSRGTARVMLWAGIAITAAFILMAVFAPVVSPYAFDQFQANGKRFAQLEAPSRDHLMGTTVQSTDVLSRVIWGTRTELKVVAGLAAALALDRHSARPRLRVLRREARPLRSS